MAEYLARRIFYAAITLLGITFAIFLLVHSVPGDPISYLASESTRALDPAAVAQIRQDFDLDRPLPARYARWLGRTLRLDFGESFVDRRPVMRRIAEKLPNTLLLNVCAFALALGVALPLGFAAAAKPGRLLDRSSGLVLILLYSLPAFWIALLLIHTLAVDLRFFPLFGMHSSNYAAMSPLQQLLDRLWHLALPVVTLAVGQCALFARFSRSAVLEAAHQPFTVAARARGLSEFRALVTHAGRNALLPMVTLLGMAVPHLLSGSVIIETIFAWDGLGRLYYDSILARDYPMIMGLTVIGAVATLLAYLITDLLYPLLDPRVRIAAGPR
jgi:peptide/nickel transport system permease protein